MFGLLMQIEDAADVTAKYVYDGEIEIATASSKLKQIQSYENRRPVCGFYMIDDFRA